MLDVLEVLVDEREVLEEDRDVELVDDVELLVADDVELEEREELVELVVADVDDVELVVAEVEEIDEVVAEVEEVDDELAVVELEELVELLLAVVLDVELVVAEVELVDELDCVELDDIEVEEVVAEVELVDELLAVVDDVDIVEDDEAVLDDVLDVVAVVLEELERVVVAVVEVDVDDVVGGASGAGGRLACSVSSRNESALIVKAIGRLSMKLFTYPVISILIGQEFRRLSYPFNAGAARQSPIGWFGSPGRINVILVIAEEKRVCSSCGKLRASTTTELEGMIIERRSTSSSAR